VLLFGVHPGPAALELSWVRRVALCPSKSATWISLCGSCFCLKAILVRPMPGEPVIASTVLLANVCACCLRLPP